MKPRHAGACAFELVTEKANVLDCYRRFPLVRGVLSLALADRSSHQRPLDLIYSQAAFKAKFGTRALIVATYFMGAAFIFAGLLVVYPTLLASSR